MRTKREEDIWVDKNQVNQMKNQNVLEKIT
jgi:hypothetical protein